MLVVVLDLKKILPAYFPINIFSAIKRSEHHIRSKISKVWNTYKDKYLHKRGFGCLGLEEEDEEEEEARICTRLRSAVGLDWVHRRKRR